jgi:actin-like ATPase involved in cell morphogenesis
MAARVLGLDFGTTNSLSSYINERGRAVALTNVEDLRPHPSAVWYRGGEVIVGRDARAHLDAGQEAISGAFVRSPKRLIAYESPIDVEGITMDPRDVVADVLRFLRVDAVSRARGRAAQELSRAVMTVPVELDGEGRRRLREAARKAGIAVEQFVHEPLAALYGWLRSQEDYQRKVSELEGRRILVFDWGGGTLDLTLCMVRDHKMMQLASAGDNEVGGDYFDELIRTRLREAHAREFHIENIEQYETPDTKTRLLQQCEQAKISLSEDSAFPILVTNYLKKEEGRTLSRTITRNDIESWTGDLIDRGLTQIDRLLEQNGLTHQEVELCLPTGGMVNLPAIRAGLVQRFGGRVPRLDDGDQIISVGAAWIAHDQLRLSLAKPIEIKEPDGGYLEIVSDQQRLPVENEHVPIAATQFYCCDPRDGVANFQFVRPARVGYGARTSSRLTYTTLSLRVDPHSQPLTERLEIQLSIDHDYVVHVSGTSTGRGDKAKKEIHNLEFALALPRASGRLASSDEDVTKSAADLADQGKCENADDMRTVKGAAQLRSNVVLSSKSWRDVPGDIIERWRPNWFDIRASQPSKRQQNERAYYLPCSSCKRTGYLINKDGCHSCGLSPSQP